MRSLITDAKYRRNTRALTFIGACCADLLLEVSAEMLEWDGCSAVYVTPIPSSPLRWIRHGYNHMRTIATICAKALPLKAILKRVHLFESPQVSKDAQSRKNTPPEFRVRPYANTLGDSHTGIIIFDDVCTTGSTLNSALATLTSVSPNTPIRCITCATALYTKPML